MYGEQKDLGIEFIFNLFKASSLRQEYILGLGILICQMRRSDYLISYILNSSDILRFSHWQDGLWCIIHFCCSSYKCRINSGVGQVISVTTCIIKGPKGIVGRQVLCYVLHGGRVDVKKNKTVNGFKEVVDECVCYYATVSHDHLFSYRKQSHHLDVQRKLNKCLVNFMTHALLA